MVLKAPPVPIPPPPPPLCTTWLPGFGTKQSSISQFVCRKRSAECDIMARHSEITNTSQPKKVTRVTSAASTTRRRANDELSKAMMESLFRCAPPIVGAAGKSGTGVDPQRPQQTAGCTGTRKDHMQLKWPSDTKLSPQSTSFSPSLQDTRDPSPESSMDSSAVTPATGGILLLIVIVCESVALLSAELESSLLPTSTRPADIATFQALFAPAAVPRCKVGLLLCVMSRVML